MSHTIHDLLAARRATSQPRRENGPRFREPAAILRVVTVILRTERVLAGLPGLVISVEFSS